MANPLSRRLRTSLFYALRTAFRLTPMPQITRDKLRQRFLDTRGHWVPEGPKGKMPGGDLPRRPYVRSDERAIGYVPYQKGELPDPLPATLVAFYLPQFHTIPENDEWWGKGFTEWRNVTRALPQFEGHYQPKLPGDLGFYDLRNVEVMHEQARLAREYGISAFCFYFYWFGGKTLLETPLRNWLNDKTIDLKFCLCWANEKWTRTWDGRGDEILIDQKHSPEDDIAFIEHVAEYMRDPRYLRVDGKPIIAVYRPSHLPDAAATAKRWRAWWSEHERGEIHIAYVQSFDMAYPAAFGFDSAIQFPPNQGERKPVSEVSLINRNYSGKTLDWRAMAASFMRESKSPYLRHQGVNCGWDNESRRTGQGQTFVYSSPRAYRDWLEWCLRHQANGCRAPLIFINAWNEWAEGAVLEPNSLEGHAYLENTRRALTSVTSEKRGIATRTHVILHAWYVEVLEGILLKLRSAREDWLLIVTTNAANYGKVAAMVSTYFSDAQIICVENRGRDVLPFLRVANQLLDRGVDIALKIHTKRSPHLTDGDRWRDEMLNGLIGGDSPALLDAAFRSQPSLGIVAPAGHLLPVQPYLGANGSRLSRLLANAGLRIQNEEQAMFPAGSMFWARLSALRPLLDQPLVTSDFEDEKGQIDGTLAHAFERAFGVCVVATGYRLVDSSMLSPLSISSSKQYPYARRS